MLTGTGRVVRRSLWLIGVGVTVAVHGASRPAPSELLEVADLRIAGAHEVGRLLAALARRLEVAGA